MAYAYAWASGLIQIGPSVPDGALAIMRGRERDVRKTIEARSRHGYDGSFLVPGVPEARDQDEGLDALIRFRDWLAEKPVAQRARKTSEVA